MHERLSRRMNINKRKDIEKQLLPDIELTFYSSTSEIYCYGNSEAVNKHKEYMISKGYEVEDIHGIGNNEGLKIEYLLKK